MRNFRKLPSVKSPLHLGLIACIGCYVLFGLTIIIQARGQASAVTSRGSLRPVRTDRKAKAGDPSSTPANALQAELAHQTELLDIDRQKLELQRAHLEERSAEIDKRADQLSHLISEMTIGSSVYTLLLGLFAFFSLKAAQGDADRLLNTMKERAKEEREARDKQAEKDQAKREEQEEEDRKRRDAEFNAFKIEVRDDIPSLYGLQKALGTLLRRIRSQVDMSKSWVSSEAYTSMSERQRQEILLAEQTVASFDYFRFQSSETHSVIVALIFADLANFYGSRSLTSMPVFNQADMQRAFVYVNRACEMDKANPRHLSQRAALILTNKERSTDPLSEAQLSAAEEDLETCLELSPVDARGLYNLAWVQDERKSPATAVELLTKIVDRKDLLPRDDRGRRMVAVFMNRACARANVIRSLLSVNPSQCSPADAAKIQAATREILADCREAREEAGSYDEEEYCRKSFKREFASTGELYTVSSLFSPQDWLALGDFRD